MGNVKCKKSQILNLALTDFSQDNSAGSDRSRLFCEWPACQQRRPHQELLLGQQPRRRIGSHIHDSEIPPKSLSPNALSAGARELKSALVLRCPSSQSRGLGGRGIYNDAETLEREVLWIPRVRLNSGFKLLDGEVGQLILEMVN